MKGREGRKRQKKEARTGDGRASFQEVLFVLFGCVVIIIIT